MMTWRQDTYFASLGAKGRCLGCWGYIFSGPREDQPPEEQWETLGNSVLEFVFPALGAGVAQFEGVEKMTPILEDSYTVLRHNLRAQRRGKKNFLLPKVLGPLLLLRKEFFGGSLPF